MAILSGEFEHSVQVGKKNKMKTAIVTGGTRGIGRAIVERLQREKYFVFFTYKNSDSIAREIESAYEDGSVKGVRLDINDHQDVQNFVKEVQAKTSKIDLIVLNAGITKDSLFATMTQDDWVSVNRTNHLDNFFLLQAVAKVMIYQKDGQIVFVSSVAGFGGSPGQSNYSSSKGAINSFAKNLSKEMGKHKVRVNVVSPGFIETDMSKKVNPMYLRDLVRTIPLGRMGKPNEVAAVVSFLASEEAAYVHGTNIVVDGGLV